MKNILLLLFLVPMFAYGQTFHYSKIIDGRDTVIRKGLFLKKEFSGGIEYTLFPKPVFGVDEFINMSFLVFGQRTYVRVGDLIYFKDFLDTDYFFEFDTKIVIQTKTKEIQFLK